MSSIAVTRLTVENVVKNYFDILGEYVQLDEHNNMCYIFERADPYLQEKPGKAAIVKDGLHLMFPFIKCFDRLKWMARQVDGAGSGHTGVQDLV